MLSGSMSLYLPFPWLGRPKFYVENQSRPGRKPVKFSLDGLSVSKIESVSAKKRGGRFFIIRFTLLCSNFHIIIYVSFYIHFHINP